MPISIFEILIYCSSCKNKYNMVRLIWLGIDNWREITHDRVRWREILVAAKTLEK